MERLENADILLVEDNPLDAELTLRGLKAQRGANVTWLKDGAEALDYIFKRNAYANRSEGDPRLILLDLKMPRVSGIEVTKALKRDERTKRIPIVIVTSSSEESDMVDSYNLGVNSYIVKPLDFESLAEIARQTGNYWLGVNRAVP